IGLVGPITSPCASCQSIEYLKEHNPNFFDLPEYNSNPEEYSGVIRKKYENESCELEIQLAFFSTLIKKEVIEDIGYLSEEFGVGFGDDDDYSIRAKIKGWKLYLAKDVFIFHNHRTTFKSIYSDEKISEMLKENKEKYENKHADFYDKNLKNENIGNNDSGLNNLSERGDKIISSVRFAVILIFRKLKNIVVYLKNGIKFAIFSPSNFIKKYFKYGKI
ncbi:MAG: Glycosyltransferase, partial [Candidatus Moranbacteria bacterium GW2011_GWF1_35_5]